MTDADYFFLIFLGTIAATRVFLFSSRMANPTIAGFRLRHYMFGIVLITAAFLVDNLIIYAVGLGLLADELPLIVIKGPGHREEYWRGLEDYHSPWCYSGVLVLIFVAYVFRGAVAGLI